MSLIDVNGTRLFAEEHGEGTPLVYLHEFGGDIRSWEGEIATLSGAFRCIAYSQRGYPPSDVPEDEAAYGWELAIADLKAVLDHFHLEQAYLIGLSMGAYTGLMAALHFPDRVKGIVFASGGSGSSPDLRRRYLNDSRALADILLETGVTDQPEFLEGLSRVQLQNKDRDAWQAFADRFREHDAAAMAHTLRYVQAARPSLHDFEKDLAALEVPVCLVAGDEDEAILEINLWLKRTMPYSALTIVPKTGHLINLEEPHVFHSLIRDFVGRIEASDWEPRDPRSQPLDKSGPRV